MNATALEQVAGPRRAEAARPLPDVDGVRHRFVETSRLRFHVAEVGEGEPVLLLHGWPQHWYAWRYVIPLLARSHRVIAPDLRGFGWTEAPRYGYRTGELVEDLVALLDALTLERVWVVGHELGGRLGFHLSLRLPRARARPSGRERAAPILERAPARPARVAAVVDRIRGDALARKDGAPAPARVHQDAVSARLSEFRAAVHVRGRGVHRHAPRARARTRRRTGPTQFAYREIVPTLLGKYRSTRLQVPTLMLNGTKDFAIGPGELGGHEPYADNLRVELVTDAGHFLPEERPQLVADSAVGFFERCARSARGGSG